MNDPFLHIYMNSQKALKEEVMLSGKCLPVCCFQTRRINKQRLIIYLTYIHNKKTWYYKKHHVMNSIFVLTFHSNPLDVHSLSELKMQSV